MGVGITYWPSLAPLLEDESLVDCLEVEPQFYWRELGGHGGPLRASEELEKLRQRPQVKLIHSVGCPVGGSLPADPREERLLRHCIEMLNPPWISEHLSFSGFKTEGKRTHALFLLPPPQTDDGVRQAIASIRSFRDGLETSVLVETGVNYLSPKSWEMPDGEFVARVADGADCGVLLDIHNLITNERNGRQSAREFIASLPKDRIVEIHVAGGFEKDDYWLDAHSGPSDEQAVSLCREILPVLPNVKALIFEILPSYVSEVGLPALRDHLETLQDVWSQRGRSPSNHEDIKTEPISKVRFEPPCKVEEWEESLGCLVLRQPIESRATSLLYEEPGIEVLQKLVDTFRRGMVSDTLAMTLRLLLISCGEESVERLFGEFWQERTPEKYTSTEARAFAEFLRNKRLNIPYLDDILNIECAGITTRVECIDAVARVTVDPHQLLEALGAGVIPSTIDRGEFEIEFTVDPRLTDATGFVLGH